MELKPYPTNKNLILIILIIVSGILASFIICKQISNRPYFESRYLSPAQSEASLLFDLTMEYQTNLAHQMQRFRDLPKDSNYINNVSEIKNSLFSFKVPARYKGLHLDLILSLTALEKGWQENNSLQIKQTEAKIQNILIMNDF